MRRLPAVVLLSLSAFFSCAHARQEEAPRAADSAQLARLSRLGPTSVGSSVLVLYRNTAFGYVFGPIAFKGTVWLDEQPVGDLADDTWSSVELNPGRHSVRVVGQAGGLPLQATTVVTLAPGAVLFLQLDGEQGMSMAQVKFVPRPQAPLAEIARDCREGFSLNLADQAPPPRSTARATQL